MRRVIHQLSEMRLRCLSALVLSCFALLGSGCQGSVGEAIDARAKDPMSSYRPPASTLLPGPANNPHRSGGRDYWPHFRIEPGQEQQTLDATVKAARDAGWKLEQVDAHSYTNSGSQKKFAGRETFIGIAIDGPGAAKPKGAATLSILLSTE